MEERRRFPRYEAAYEVKYSTQGNAAIESHTVSKDVSRLGLRIPVSRIVKEGNVLTLDIKPYNSGDFVRITGRVVWTRRLTRPAVLESDAGIEFTRIDSALSEKLLQPVY